MLVADRQTDRLAKKFLLLASSVLISSFWPRSLRPSPSSLSSPLGCRPSRDIVVFSLSLSGGCCIGLSFSLPPLLPHPPFLSPGHRSHADRGATLRPSNKVPGFAPIYTHLTVYDMRGGYREGLYETGNYELDDLHSPSAVLQPLATVPRQLGYIVLPVQLFPPLPSHAASEVLSGRRQLPDARARSGKFQIEKIPALSRCTSLGARKVHAVCDVEVANDRGRCVGRSADTTYCT